MGPALGHTGSGTRHSRWTHVVGQHDSGQTDVIWAVFGRTVPAAAVLAAEEADAAPATITSHTAKTDSNQSNAFQRRPAGGRQKWKYDFAF